MLGLLSRRGASPSRKAGGARCAVVAISTAAMLAAGGLLVAAPSAAEYQQGYQASSTALAAVDHARSRIGTPYRYGATGPNAFDCSGLAQWAYRQVEVYLPRTTYDQIGSGIQVSRSELRPGDLVFFYSGPSHVGIYTGNGHMVHAPNSNRSVEEVSMSGHYNSNFSGARRVV